MLETNRSLPTAPWLGAPIPGLRGSGLQQPLSDQPWGQQAGFASALRNSVTMATATWPSQPSCGEVRQEFLYFKSCYCLRGSSQKKRHVICRLGLAFPMKLISFPRKRFKGLLGARGGMEGLGHLSLP